MLKINKADFNFLIPDPESIFDNAFCPTCAKTVSITPTSFVLDDANSIIIEGVCNICKSQVCRVVEPDTSKNFKTKCNRVRIAKRGWNAQLNNK